MIAASVLTPTRPYPGIEPFSFRDRSIFFGRSGDVRRLIQLIVVYRGVLLCGESGVGKSSLINAALLPAALEEDLAPERLRVQPRPGDPLVAERIELAPGRYLPSLFADDDSTSGVSISCEALVEALRDSTGPQPLLIFDQFEEFFTLFDATTTSVERAEIANTQREIVETLTTLLTDSTLRVKIVLSLREDYLAKLQTALIAVPDLTDRYMYLQSLEATTPNVFELIRSPFEAHPEAFGHEIEIPLAKQVAAAFNDRFGADALNLTELQIVCERLWMAGTDAERQFAAEGVQGIVEHYYEGALRTLDIRLQAPAIAVLGRLVTAAGTRNIVSEQDLLLDVETEDGFPESVVKETLAALERDARLVSRERRHDIVFYEIVTEFLVPWIQAQVERQRAAEQAKNPLTVAARKWDELARSDDALLRGASLTDAAAFARRNPALIGRLERQFLEASEKHQQLEIERQERRSKAFRRLSLALGVLSVAAVVGLALAVFQWRQAENARHTADRARLAAQTSFRREANLRREQKVQLDKVSKLLQNSKVAEAQIAVTSAQQRLTNVGTSKNPRFFVRSCGSILDNALRIEWLVGPDVNLSWPAAHAWADQARKCGGGWSLPDAAQLQSLYDKRFSAGSGYVKAGRHFPALIDPVFSGIGHGSWVWTRRALGPSGAIAINMNQNAQVTFDKNEEQYPVRAFVVRKSRVLSVFEAKLANDDAYRLMKRGRYSAALPLLQVALPSLRGVASYEAFVNYNLGKTLLELGRCNAAIKYLRRAARLEGRLPAIARAEKRAASCEARPPG